MLLVQPSFFIGVDQPQCLQLFQDFLVSKWDQAMLLLDLKVPVPELCFPMTEGRMYPCGLCMRLCEYVRSGVRRAGACGDPYLEFWIIILV